MNDTTPSHPLIIKTSQHHHQTSRRLRRNMPETSPTHHWTIPKTPPNCQQNNTKTTPRHHQKKTETRPRHDRDITETRQRQDQDKTETEPRHDRDITETPPKGFWDITETSAKHYGNKTETSPWHPETPPKQRKTKTDASRRQDRDTNETWPRAWIFQSWSIIRRHTGHSYIGLPRKVHNIQIQIGILDFA